MFSAEIQNLKFIFFSSPMNRGFFSTLKKPIIAMAPMDGITDQPFRHMICKYSHPSFMVTEFTDAEGLAHGNLQTLNALYFTPSEHPLVAQIHGITPEGFYKAAVLVGHLGFDGLDLNMGCSDPRIIKKGSGAALIQNRVLAKKLIQSAQKGLKDFANGISLEEAGIHPDILTTIKARQTQSNANSTTSPKTPPLLLPLSIKTRLGFHRIAIKSWIPFLLEQKPAVIALHGRTFAQLYRGEANWESIMAAAELAHETQTWLFGNGDIKSYADAIEKIKTYGVDGVLVGRGVQGNPWFFSAHQPTPEESMLAAIEHAHYLETQCPEIHFQRIRKHLGWYCHHLPGSRKLRNELMQAETAAQVEEKIKGFLKSYTNPQ